MYGRIEIKKARGMGRGLFAADYIPADTIVEISPVIVYEQPEQDHPIDRYIFDWDGKYFGGRAALALGVGSLFNHSENPNVEWQIDKKRKEIVFYTIKDVKPGRQLYIDYGYDPLEWKDYDRLNDRS